MKKQEKNTPILTVNVGGKEVISIQADVLDGITEGKATRNLVHGIDGLADLFGCSRPTAQRIKNSGVIDKAIYQVGRTITIDADLALELVQQSDNIWSNRYGK